MMKPDYEPDTYVSVCYEVEIMVRDVPTVAAPTCDDIALALWRGLLAAVAP